MCLKKTAKKYLIPFSFPFNTNIPENIKHHSHQMHLLVYLESYQATKMERFAKIVSGLKQLNIFSKRSILGL